MSKIKSKPEAKTILNPASGFFYAISLHSSPSHSTYTLLCQSASAMPELLYIVSKCAKNPTTYTCFIIFTSRLVPSRSAPSSINFSASAKEEIPPAAFTFTFVPTYCLISSTSEKVAPAVENPVEVLMNSAPGLRSHLS